MAEKKRILVVDDEEINLLLIEGILSDDYEIFPLNSGEACLEKYLDIGPDIVLLDVEMPGMDGLDTCKKIQDLAECPVIFVSAKGSLEERLAGYAVGGYDYIVKPLDGHELQVKLQLLLAQLAEKQSLKDNIQSSFSTAMTAMTSTSELGYVIAFADKIHGAEDYQQVANTLLSTMEEFDVDSCVNIRGEVKQKFYTNNGTCSPMEKEIMELLRDKGRLYDFGRRTQVNETRLSLLVKTMPEDTDKYGRLKDHLPFILRIADGYIERLDKAYRIEFKEKKLRSTIGNVSDKLSDVERDLQVNYDICYATMGNMIEDLDKRLQFLALSEEQEEQLKEMFTLHTEQVINALDNSSAVNKTFSTILVKLRQLLV